MGIIKQEAFAGLHAENEVVCSDCVTNEEMDAMTEDELITQREIENSEDWYFCDRCKKRM